MCSVTENVYGQDKRTRSEAIHRSEAEEPCEPERSVIVGLFSGGVSYCPE
jgi:hypothetical protein